MVNEDAFSLWSSPQQQSQYLSALSELSRQPKGSEWLWHPKVVVLYKLVLQNSDISSTSREAAIGALQNITAGEARVGTSHDTEISNFPCIFRFPGRTGLVYFLFAL